VNFTTKDPAKFDRLTREHIGQWMAIFLDRTSISGATIEGVISGSGMIHGHFTQERAAALAADLNAGTLPVPVRIIEPK
jgi:preprotein translocase subunit SecD